MRSLVGLFAHGSALAGRGSALADWNPLWAFAAVFLVALGPLLITGRRGGGRLFGVPRRLEEITGVPGWAAITLMCSVYGLIVAGFGFYSDVAWHVALGRDDILFTAPHTAIIIGLVLIALGPVLGLIVALGEGARRPWAGASRLPTSLLPLGVLGAAALIGFPVDEMWHRAYGVDVTMWSPPHLIMILAASFSAMASWLVLADAGIRPTDGRWARGLHVAVAALALMGLSSVQGEFTFGVPQWQHLYHPVLFALAGGIGMVLIRLVHGRGWALGIATGIFLFHASGAIGEGPLETRTGATYLGAAFAVEIAAVLVGTGRRLRFAVASGVGVGTLGLGVEWLWNQGAYQPWTPALFPDAFIVGLPAAIAGAVIGTAVAGAVARDPGVSTVPAAVVGFALAAAFLSLAIPAPRHTGEVSADVTLRWVDEDRAVVDVAIEPEDAAERARWFTVGSWQWGGHTIRHMRQVGPGRFTSGEPILLTGEAKSLLRLHRGAEMMAIPIRLPEDPEYGFAEVQAEDRSAAFVAEQQFLQREAETADGWLARLVFLLVAVLATAWIASLAYAVSRIGRHPLVSHT